jgi:excisionase family DNA binding protein
VAETAPVVNDPFTVAIRAAVAAEFAPVLELLEGMSTPPKYLTNEELAARLQVSLPTIRKLVEAGMPCLYLGEVRRYSIDAVERWLGERTKAGAA